MYCVAIFNNKKNIHFAIILGFHIYFYLYKIYIYISVDNGNHVKDTLHKTLLQTPVILIDAGNTAAGGLP